MKTENRIVNSTKPENQFINVMRTGNKGGSLDITECLFVRPPRTYIIYSLLFRGCQAEVPIHALTNDISLAELLWLIWFGGGIKIFFL